MTALVTISANLLNLLILAIDAGFAVTQLSAAIKELKALDAAQLEEVLKLAEVARQAERDRRKMHAAQIEAEMKGTKDG